MKPAQKIALVVGAGVVLLVATTVVLNLRAKPTDVAPQNPPQNQPQQQTVTGPREADAAALAVVAPLVKGGNLLNYTARTIMLVPGQGMVVTLAKAGGFYPDGGASDGGANCDPSQVDEARLTIALAPLAPAATPAFKKGPYAIFVSPQNVPQFEADRLGAAFAELVNAKAPVPASLSDGSEQLH